MNIECDHNRAVQSTNVYGLLDLRCGDCDKRLAWEHMNREAETIEIQATSAHYEQLLRDVLQEGK